MWQFGKERRHHPRYKVKWKARLHCAFSDVQEIIPVEVVDVSLGGVRLQLKKLQVGRHHLKISHEPPILWLEILRPRGTLEIAVELRWYDRVEGRDLFIVGMEFLGVSGEARGLLQQEIDDVIKDQFGQPLP